MLGFPIIPVAIEIARTYRTPCKVRHKCDPQPKNVPPKNKTQLKLITTNFLSEKVILSSRMKVNFHISPIFLEIMMAEENTSPIKYRENLEINVSLSVLMPNSVQLKFVEMLPKLNPIRFYELERTPRFFEYLSRLCVTFAVDFIEQQLII
jgi:hypothetical protein